MLEIKERDPFSSLVLEVLDDPTKKEILFYIVCYSQLVKREGSLRVELNRFLSCAYRNFRSTRNHWKDLLVEMNLFVISDLYGNLYAGKDIYRIKDGGVYLISLKGEYLHLLESMSHKAIRLWNILSRTMLYRRRHTAQEAIVLSALMFNEEVYEELQNYCEMAVERYPAEAPYFRAVGRLSRIYAGKESNLYQGLKEVLDELEVFNHVYYGLNLSKLKKDVQNLLEKVEKGKGLEVVKIEFANQEKGKESWLRKLFRKIKEVLGRLWIGKKEKMTCSSGGVLCSKNFQTLYIN